MAVDWFLDRIFKFCPFVGFRNLQPGHRLSHLRNCNDRLKKAWGRRIEWSLMHCD